MPPEPGFPRVREERVSVPDVVLVTNTAFIVTSALMLEMVTLDEPVRVNAGSLSVTSTPVCD